MTTQILIFLLEAGHLITRQDLLQGPQFRPQAFLSFRLAGFLSVSNRALSLLSPP